jgi:predicted nuclease with TOPRIM domain
MLNLESIKSRLTTVKPYLTANICEDVNELIKEIHKLRSSFSQSETDLRRARVEVIMLKNALARVMQELIDVKSQAN